MDTKQIKYDLTIAQDFIMMLPDVINGVNRTDDKIRVLSLLKGVKDEIQK